MTTYEKIKLNEKTASDEETTLSEETASGEETTLSEETILDEETASDKGRKLSEWFRENHLKRKQEKAQLRLLELQSIDEGLEDKAPFFMIPDEEEAKKTQALWGRFAEGRYADWVAYYSGVHGRYDARFLPDSVYYMDIDPFFNDIQAARYIDHKGYYLRLFPDIKQPELISTRISGQWLDSRYHFTDIGEVLAQCGRAGKVIVKPAAGYCGGLGVRLWDGRTQDTDVLSKIIGRNIGDVVIQKVVKQHSVLERLHPQSVNTIRTISLNYKGKIRILSSVIRTGTGENCVDNISAGGISIGIDENGRMKGCGYDKTGNRYTKHPDGAVFGKDRVPGYHKLCEVISEAHMGLPKFRLVSWDFAIDEAGEPVMIEANLCNGELDFHQFNNGPLFGEMTGEILQEVYKRTLSQLRFKELVKGDARERAANIELCIEKLKEEHMREEDGC